MPELITSHTNPKVKNLVRLGKGRGKDRKESFIFEGLKEFELALCAGIEIESVFYCEDVCDKETIKILSDNFDQHKLFKITAEIFARIAYRDSTGGILVLAKSHYLGISDIHLPENPLVLVLESVEKPGNLGGILRTADAAGVDLVMVCDPLTDLYNPNIIRNSLGCVFTVPVVVCPSEEAVKFLKDNNIQILVTDLNTQHNYNEINYRRSSAIVMGTEHDGTSATWLDIADIRVKIPMLGRIDSLNVSTSTAILVYEAVRQRSCT